MRFISGVEKRSWGTNRNRLSEKQVTWSCGRLITARWYRPINYVYKTRRARNAFETHHQQHTYNSVRWIERLNQRAMCGPTTSRFPRDKSSRCEISPTTDSSCPRCVGAAPEVDMPSCPSNRTPRQSARHWLSRNSKT